MASSQVSTIPAGLDGKAHTAASIQGCGQARTRGRVVVAGTIRSVVIPAHGQRPTFEAELSDETGTVRLIWLGRRSIAGVEPGRQMIAEGFASQTDPVPTIYNPRFELQTSPGADS